MKRDGRLVVLSGLFVTVLLAASACSRTSDPSPSTAAGAAAAPTGPSAADAEGEATPEVPAAPSAPATRTVSSLSNADELAGIVSRRVVNDLGGRLVTVPGDVRAPGGGDVVRIKVQVDQGLPVDGRVFAAFVLGTLNDRRSWGHGGTRTFARTDGVADVRVVLASPQTSREMCRPLETLGRLSCRSGDAAVLTYYRWVNAIEDYGRDRTGYRRYVVNHEVGHALGHGHEQCPGRGEVAPVMMQQTKGLLGCKPNPWPFP